MTSNPISRRRRAALVVAATASLFLASCGSSDVADDSDADAGTAQVESDDAADVADADVSEAETEPAEDNSGGVFEAAPVAVSGESLPEFASADDDPAVGTPSPVLDGVGFDGSAITVGGPTEQPTFVVFLAHWCPHCNDEIPEILELQEQGRLPDGLDIVGVSTAVEQDRDNYPPSQWIVDKEWTYPTMVDSDDVAALRAVGANSFPFALVLDTDGTVLARKAGQSSGDDTVAFLEAALATAQA